MDRKEENSSTYKLAYELISTDGRIAYVDAANGAVVNYDYWFGCYEPGDLVALRVWHWKENSTEFDFKRIKAQARVNRACAFIITDLLYIHCEQYCFSGLMVSGQREMMLSTLAYIYAYKCWQLQHIVVYKSYSVICAPPQWGFRIPFGSHTLLSLYLRSIMLPFEIRAIAPSWFNDYAVRSFFAAFSTCTPPCRRAMMCLYLRH